MADPHPTHDHRRAPLRPRGSRRDANAHPDPGTQRTIDAVLEAAGANAEHGRAVAEHAVLLGLLGPAGGLA